MKELCRISLVNSKWKELSEENEFWKKFCEEIVPTWKWEYCELESKFENWKTIYKDNRIYKQNQNKKRKSKKIKKKKLFSNGLLDKIATKMGIKKINPFELAMFGLDKSGRKAILNKTKFGEVTCANPLTGINIEYLNTKKISIVSFDVGKDISPPPRPFWEFFVDHKDGLIFVVDSTDRERVKEAETELFQVLKRKGLMGVRVLILAHKIQQENSMTLEEIVQNLSLNKIVKRQWHIQLCCEKTGEGIREGFDWIINVGKNKSFSYF